MRLVSWLLVNMLSLAAAAWLFDGITLGGRQWTDKALTLLVVGGIMGIVGSVVKPIVKTLSFPFIVLTLGLLLLVINALMLLLTSKLAEVLGSALQIRGFGLQVDGFWTAVGGAIVISIASAILGAVLPDGRSED